LYTARLRRAVRRAEREPMKRYLLFACLFATPAFAATMNNFASQLGGTNLVQLTPADSPLLTTTFAGTSFQSAFPSDLIFVTNVAPLGTFTLCYTVTLGAQQFNIATATYSCTDPSGCFIDADFVLPSFFHPTAGTLRVSLNGSDFSYGFTFRSPVPEPTSLILLGTGIVGVAWRKFRGAAKL